MRRLLQNPRPDAVPALSARACVLVGLLDIAAAVLPPPGPGRSGPLGPVTAALALGSGVLLLLLPRGLRGGERRAWRAAGVLLPFGACAQVAYRHPTAGAALLPLLILPLLIPSLLLWLLVKERDRFGALPHQRSRWRALTHFTLLGAGSILLGLAVVSAHPHQLIGSPSMAERLEHVLYGLFGVAGPLVYAGPASSTVAYSLGALGIVTAVTTGYLALRPGHPAARRPEGVVFSPSGKAAVRYRVVHGVMLAAGDPAGDVAAWPGAIERFMDEARAHAWTPAVTGCSEEGADVWTRETGLIPLEPGAAADPATGAAPEEDRLPRARPGGLPVFLPR